MKNLEHLAPLADLSGARCDGDAVVSSVMEAVSFVTPALEGFFIKTIARVRSTQSDPELDQRAREFMREEAEHTRAHRKLNAALLGYLGRTAASACVWSRPCSTGWTGTCLCRCALRWLPRSSTSPP